MMIPKRLHKGDLVGVIAPASPPCIDRLQRGVLFLQELGLRVQLGKHIDCIYGYLAGTDAQRLADFHDMISNRAIKGIFFARGGYGSGRFAADIDYDLIRDNPKIIWGYSDITYLHTAIRQKSRLVTFHGPMMESDIGKDDIDERTKHMFQQLFAPRSIYYTEKISPLNILVHGEVTGALVGGNLSLLTSTFGTPFEIDVKDKIVMLEEIREEPYRVDAMLNQWKLAGKLSEMAGMMIGDFAQADPTRAPSLSLQEVLQHYSSEVNGPVMTGFQIGHCFPHIAIPFGVQAKISTKEKNVIIDPGVIAGVQ